MTYTVTVGGHIGHGATPYVTELAFTLVNTADGTTTYGPFTVDIGTAVATFSVTVAGVYAVHAHDTHSPPRIIDQYCSQGAIHLAGFGDPTTAAATVPLTVTSGDISGGGTTTFDASDLTDLALPAGNFAGHVYVADNSTDWHFQGPGLYTVDVMTGAGTVYHTGQEHYTPELIADSNDGPGVFLVPVPADGTHFAIRVTRVADAAVTWLMGWTPSAPEGGSGSSFAGATKFVYEPTTDPFDDRQMQVGHETDPDNYPGYLVLFADTATFTVPVVHPTWPVGLGAEPLNVQIGMVATLTADYVPAPLPSHFTDPQVRARRLSLIMPAPSLDGRGRPT